MSNRINAINYIIIELSETFWQNGVYRQHLVTLLMYTFSKVKNVNKCKCSVKICENISLILIMNELNVIHVTSDRIYYLNPDILNSFSNLTLVSVTGHSVKMNPLTLASFHSDLTKFLNMEDSEMCLFQA